MATRRGGVMQVSGEALCGLLQSPEGTEVMDVRFDTYKNRIELLLSGPAMPVWPEGYGPVRVEPVYTATYHECGHETVETDWGDGLRL